MKAILELARLNLLQIVRNRSELISILVLPVMLTLIFGMAFGGGGGASKIRVAFTDDDGSAYSRQFRSLLAEEDAFVVEDVSLDEAKERLADGEIAAAVHVRDGFGQRLERNEITQVVVTRDPASSQTLAVGEIVQGAAERIAANAHAAILARDAIGSVRADFLGKPLPSPAEHGHGTSAELANADAGAKAPGAAQAPESLAALATVPVGELPEDVRGALSASFPYLDADPGFADVYEKADAHWEPAPPVKVAEEAVTPSDVRGDSTTAEGFAQYSLGFTVMFVLFIALNSAGGILEERENGTLQRLLVTPATKRQILGGKVLGVLLTASVEAAILIVLGVVAFDVPWGRDPVALLMVVGAYVLCATGFAVLVSALVRTRGQMSALGTISAVALAMIGGAYWPIEVVSPFMRKLAEFTFTGWAMSWLVDVVARNQGFAAAATPALVLLGFAVAFFVAGSALLKFE